MRRHLSYSNVIATLALFIALGGSSYAALKITGRDVANGSLTGKDIKKRSVPVNRLKGKLPKGAQGAKGDPGERGLQGPPGPVDPSQFVSSSGLYEVTVGPGAWQSLDSALERSSVFGHWRTVGAGGSTVLLLDPAIPGTVAGHAMRLRAVTLCWHTTTDVVISDVIISAYRENAAADTTDVVEQEEPSDHIEKLCRRYDFATPVDLSNGRRVTVRLSVGWEPAAATLVVGGATFELDRAP